MSVQAHQRGGALSTLVFPLSAVEVGLVAGADEQTRWGRVMTAGASLGSGVCSATASGTWRQARH